MKIYTKHFLGVFFALAFWGCINSPDYSDVPSIEFVGFTKSVLNQGSINNDTTQLVISFTDGDGDIGFGEENLGESNIFLKDNRTGEIYDQFRAPTIPEEGANNGVSGEIRMVLFNTCCLFPDQIPPCSIVDEFPTNDLSFSIYIEDRAGNKSNEIQTPIITLLCN